jgi:hypothetical protein
MAPFVSNQDCMKTNERAGVRRRAEKDPDRDRRWPDAPRVRMRPVKSSAIDAVGYDAERCLLHVRFRHTGLYTYRDVPPDVFEAFLAASSKGRFYNQYVRSAFQFQRRIEPGGDDALASGPPR